MKYSPNILIVDDTLENIHFLKAVLRKMPASLITAFSGGEALEKTKGVELALAILDVRMPEMNGYELAVKLNEERIENKVPIIFITANHFDEIELFKGYNSGAVDYIFKPINNHVLVSKVNIFLDLFNQKQALIENDKLLKNYANKITKVNVDLKKSEEKYRQYIDNAPDGVFVVDETGRFIEVNDALSDITGYPKDELLSMSILHLLSDNSFNNVTLDFKHLTKTGVLNGDSLFKKKDKSERWWTLVAVKLAVNRFLCFAKDINSRKEAEEELKSSLEQLHELAEHIEVVREKERVNIARELHDDLGQSLTAIKIDLGLIKKNVFEENTVSRIEKASSLVNETIKTVQRLTSQLRPHIIDDLGIDEAIRWYIKEYTTRFEMDVSLALEADLPLSIDASLIVFRIMQESLTNVARHSKASKANLSLKMKNDLIYFTIEDNGIGITESEISSKKSFGLLGMKERASSLGGTLDIYNKKGHGTVIMLIFPL